MDDFKKDTELNEQKTINLFFENQSKDRLSEIIENFLSNPFDTGIIELLIQEASREPFRISIDFFSVLLDNISEEPTDYIHCSLHFLEIILNFPLSNFSFDLPIKFIVEKLINYFKIFPEAVSIITIFLQKENIENLYNIDQMYLDLSIPQIVFSSYAPDNLEISSQILKFFRYWLKTKFAFLDDFRAQYDTLYKYSIQEETPLKDNCIHTVYHYVKKETERIRKHDKEMEKIRKHQKKKKKQNGAEEQKLVKDEGQVMVETGNQHKIRDLPFPLFFEKVDTFQGNSPIFHKYLIKIFHKITQIKKMCYTHLDEIQAIIPYIMFILNTSLTEEFFDVEDVLCALRCIYNCYIDAHSHAAPLFYNISLGDLLFQLYDKFGYDIQKETLWVFIEYLRYADINEIASLYENHNVIDAFVDLLSHDDRNFGGDLFLSLLDLFDKIENSKQHYYMYEYFFNQDFIDIVVTVGPGLSYFDEFYKKLMLKQENIEADIT